MKINIYNYNIRHTCCISIHCFSFCDSHPLIVMFPVSYKCMEFRQGVFSKYPQKLPSKPQKTLGTAQISRETWSQMGGINKKHTASIDGKFDAFKTRSMCPNFRGTTIKTDAKHGIQVQNYHHHTAPPSPSPNHLQYPSSNTKKRHATFQSMLQFFQHWLGALMTCQSAKQGMLKSSSMLSGLAFF